MSTDFKDVMSKRTDEELIKIVTVDRNGYQPLAVAAAEEEIKNRNIDIEKVEQVESEFNAEIEEKKHLNDKTVSSLIRFVHFIIDTIAWIIATFVSVFLLGVLLKILSISLNDEFAREYAMSFGLAIYIITYICYYYIMEVKYQKTVAKFITKTKVVTNNGSKPNEKDILARTLFRLIPFDRISFLFTQNGFHDRLSNTRIIKDDRIESQNTNNANT